MRLKQLNEPKINKLNLCSYTKKIKNGMLYQTMMILKTMCTMIRVMSQRIEVNHEKIKKMRNISQIQN